jgi:hypothetical protein
MKRLLLISLIAMLFSGCHDNECECGKVTDKHELHIGKDTYYSIEVENNCTGHPRYFQEKATVYFDTEIGTIYCVDFEW